MPNPALRTERLRLDALPAELAAAIERAVRGESIVLIERDGTTIAAIISARNAAQTQPSNASGSAEFAAIDRIRAAFADVPDDELEREVERAVAEARAELRAEREAKERESRQRTA